MKNFSNTVLLKNEKGDKVEQKQSRSMRATIIDEFAKNFEQVEVQGTKTYVLVAFKDNETVWVELSASIKNLDFQPFN